jgi:hypothetical protein
VCKKTPQGLCSPVCGLCGVFLCLCSTVCAQFASRKMHTLAILLHLLAGLGSLNAQTIPVNDLALSTRACQGKFASLPYCDTTLSMEARVEDFIERLWANESWIPPQLTARHGGGGSPGPTDAVPELGLPEFDWGLNCIHGTQSSCVSQGGVTYCPTSFMNPVGFGATFNDTLIFSVAQVIAEETRALWLAGAVEESDWSGRPHIGLDLWSPNVNINRDPRVSGAATPPVLWPAFSHPTVLWPAFSHTPPPFPPAPPHPPPPLPLSGAATWRWPLRSP